MQLCCRLIYLHSFSMNKKINWDALGITASLACAIHCAFLPLFFTSLPVFGVNVIENTVFEILMVAVAFVLGTFALYHGYKKHHHNILPIIVFAAGFAFLILKLFFAEFENWLLIPAVFGIISSHMINYKFCRLHNHAHTEDCNH